MKLSPKQMQAFHKNQRVLFENKCYEMLSNDLPDHSKAHGEESFRQLIAEMIDIAAEYEIKIQRSVYKFIALGVLSGRDFHTKVEVKAILDNAAYDPCLKVDILYYATKKLSLIHI